MVRWVQVLSDIAYNNLPKCYMVKDDGMTQSDKGAHIIGDLISKELQMPSLSSDTQNSTSGSYTGSTNQKPSAPLQPAPPQQVSRSASSSIYLHTISNPKKLAELKVTDSQYKACEAVKHLYSYIQNLFDQLLYTY